MFLKSSVAKIKKTQSGKQIYETIKYPTINKHENDIYIVSKYNDRLELLASKYYNDQSKYWIIGKANHISTMSINPGVQIRIPMDIDNIILEFINLNK